MKALVVHGPKDLRIEHRAPEAPGPGEVMVTLAAGGICGSDLHYFHHGGFGNVRIREPMILGHEVSGRVESLGKGVNTLRVGQLVAVSPSRPCGACDACRRGLPNHCPDMRFYGSAMPFPHVQGAFRESLVADASQCVPADDLDAGAAALAEPLAVCLHAQTLAGDLFGKRVLVTGCGPIGLLSILVARSAGASEIVATDITPFTLEAARQHGADRVIDASLIQDHPNCDDPLAPFARGKGTLDVHFECSGAASALAAGVRALRPRGTIVQLGIGGDTSVPLHVITAKELRLVGSFRFHEEFRAAIDMMRRRVIDPTTLITHRHPLDDAINAFQRASDRDSAIKVQLVFA